MGLSFPSCQYLHCLRNPSLFRCTDRNSIRVQALEKDIQSLMLKRALELAPLPSPGFYSRLFVVMKASGSWGPVIVFVYPQSESKTSFKMETLQSLLLSVRSGDWMVFIDLGDSYLQVPILPDSHKYLRSVALNLVFNSRLFVSASSQLCRFSHGAWLRYRPFSIV